MYVQNPYYNNLVTDRDLAADRVVKGKRRVQLCASLKG